MKTNLQANSNLRFDSTAVKILFSILAIVCASLFTPASAATGPIQWETGISSVLTSDLKSCPVPYSPEYCSHEDMTFKTCGSSEHSWLPILNKYSFQNASMKPLCPMLNGSTGQNSES